MEAVTLTHGTDSVTLTLNYLLAFFEGLSGSEKTAFIQMFQINEARSPSLPPLSPMLPYFESPPQQLMFPSPPQQPQSPFVIHSPPADAAPGGGGAAPFTPLSRFSFVREEEVDAMESESEQQDD